MRIPFLRGKIAQLVHLYLIPPLRLFWCRCISRACRKAKLPRTHKVARMHVWSSSWYAYMLPKCFPKHASSHLEMPKCCPGMSAEACCTETNRQHIKLMYRSKKQVKLSSTDEHQRRRKSAFKAAEPIQVASGCSRLRQLTLALSRDGGKGIAGREQRELWRADFSC